MMNKDLFKPKLKVIIVGLTFPKEERMVFSYWVPKGSTVAELCFWYLCRLCLLVTWSFPCPYSLNLYHKESKPSVFKLWHITKILWEKWILKACLYTTKDAYVWVKHWGELWKKFVSMSSTERFTCGKTENCRLWHKLLNALVHIVEVHLLLTLSTENSSRREKEGVTSWSIVFMKKIKVSWLLFLMLH